MTKNFTDAQEAQDFTSLHCPSHQLAMQPCQLPLHPPENKNQCMHTEYSQATSYRLCCTATACWPSIPLKQSSSKAVQRSAGKNSRWLRYCFASVGRLTSVLLLYGTKQTPDNEDSFARQQPLSRCVQSSAIVQHSFLHIQERTHT